MTERDLMQFDVVIVGAGPAGLCTAIHLGNLIERHNSAVQSSGQGQRLSPEICVIEKAAEIGAHSLSGAVMDPRALDALLPGWRTMEPKAPVEAEVNTDYALWLTARGGMRMPITPPPLRNHGNFVVSLNRVVKWLGGIAESKGIQVFPGFPGAVLRRDGAKVTGVQLADAGVDKHGKRKGNYQPGGILAGKLVVLAEGSRGSMTKQLVADLGLQGKNPQVYAIGAKEVWEVPNGQCPPGLVVHTMGYPLDGNTFGGGWVYGMGERQAGKNLVSVGLVVGLDYRDPTMDAHRKLQLMKLNPRIAAFLRGGKMLHYGAKSLPEGGLYSMPKHHGDGFVIVGDSAGLMNSMRLKGIHLAMRSGMLAAETALECLKKDDFSAAATAHYAVALQKDWVHDELRQCRNFHQGFHKGRFLGLVNAGFAQFFGGKGMFWSDELASNAGHTYMQKVGQYFGGAGKPKLDKLADDGVLTFDKLTSVYSSGTMHEEDQPCHLVVTEPDLCSTRCVEEFGNPCQHFCPASVYEMEAKPGRKHGIDLKINASNCVHCKTCDIMDPYQVINWVTPEGGGGPNYQNL
ncbi:MAG TPA: electron transfer flavoprotein-ubiquinone oxidoreductase [Planctomycetota bacterium]|nr:electron transfer flavoprotein-ubiquinone oxidoreductase [Planctomycetota bacterium]